MARSETSNHIRPMSWKDEGSFVHRLRLVMSPASMALSIKEHPSELADRHALYMILFLFLTERFPDTVRAVLSFWKLGIADGIGELLMTLGTVMRTDGLPVLVFTVLLYLAQGSEEHDWDQAFEGALWAWFPGMVTRVLVNVLQWAGLARFPTVSGFSLGTVLGLLFTLFYAFFFWRAFSGRMKGSISLAGMRETAGVLAAMAVPLVLPWLHISEVVRHEMPIGVGDPAPGFELPAVDGGTCTLGDGRAALLVFWSVTCPVCREELRMLPELRDRADEVYLIHSWGGAAMAARARQAAGDVPFRICLDDGRIAERYKVRAVPYMVVVDRRGRLHSVFRGRTSVSTLRHALEEASK